MIDTREIELNGKYENKNITVFVQVDTLVDILYQTSDKEQIEFLKSHIKPYGKEDTEDLTYEEIAEIVWQNDNEIEKKMPNLFEDIINHYDKYKYDFEPEYTYEDWQEDNKAD